MTEKKLTPFQEGSKNTFLQIERVFRLIVNSKRITAYTKTEEVNFEIIDKVRLTEALMMRVVEFEAKNREWIWGEDWFINSESIESSTDLMSYKRWNIAGLSKKEIIDRYSTLKSYCIQIGSFYEKLGLGRELQISKLLLFKISDIYHITNLMLSERTVEFEKQFNQYSEHIESVKNALEEIDLSNELKQRLITLINDYQSVLKEYCYSLSDKIGHDIR